MNEATKTNGTFEYFNCAVAQAKNVPGQEWIAYDENAFSKDVWKIQKDLYSEPLAMEILGCLLDLGVFRMSGCEGYTTVALYTGEYSSYEYDRTVRALREALPRMLEIDTTNLHNGCHINYTITWKSLEDWKRETFEYSCQAEGCDSCANDTSGYTCEHCYAVWQEHLHGTYINYMELAKELLQSIAEDINEGHNRHIFEYAEDLEGIIERYRYAMFNERVDLLDFLDSTREQYDLLKANQHRLKMAFQYID